MNLREALIQQAPSLTLQRAASDEISKMDSLVLDLAKYLDEISLGNLNGSEPALTELLKKVYGKEFV